jgi:thiosulfate/3-mercaptopyruvate sulfurtransferase
MTRTVRLIGPGISLCAALLVGARLGGAQASSSILVSTQWLAQHLRDADLVVIHTSGQKSDYDAGHVPGARFLPWQSFATQRDGLSSELPDPALLDSALEAIGVSDHSRIVVTGGPITNTARLFFTLDYFGLGARLSLLDGGIDAWREEGRPLERAAAPTPRGTVTLHPQSDKLVDAHWIMTKAGLQDGHVAVLDARVPEYFEGLLANNTPRAGHLPTAQNVPYSWLTGELTRFRDRDKLARLFARAGVTPGDTVVTYCHIGMQASVLYVAARLLGYPAAVYDGSFEDWSRRSELPVAGAVPARPPHR